MHQPDKLTAEEIRESVTPALNILWCIKLEVQGHVCRYQQDIMHGIDGLLNLLKPLPGYYDAVEIRECIITAQNILLRIITLQQGHTCFYHAKLPLAISGLEKLLNMERDDGAA